MDDVKFGKCVLSERTIEKLKIIKETLNNDLEAANNTWKILFQSETKHKREDCKKNCNEVTMEIDDDQFKKPDSPKSDNCEIPSSQFFFTQTKSRENYSSSKKQVERSVSDMIDSLYIALELATGNLNPEDMKSLTDTNAVEIIDKLSPRLTSKGVYNLCFSVCNMESSLETYYAQIICSKLLLPKIIELENSPSRLELSAVIKMTETFSEDVRKFLLVPLFNENLKNHKVIQELIKHYDGVSKIEIILDFIETVKELKLWHIAVLPTLIDINIENDAKTKILSLLVDKALTYAEDKSYSQCILSFIKTQSPFTDEQKNMLHEIVIVHKTIFKRPMLNKLEEMFLHRNVWHVS